LRSKLKSFKKEIKKKQEEFASIKKDFTKQPLFSIFGTKVEPELTVEFQNFKKEIEIFEKIKKSLVKIDEKEVEQASDIIKKYAILKNKLLDLSSKDPKDLANQNEINEATKNLKTLEETISKEYGSFTAKLNELHRANRGLEAMAEELKALKKHVQDNKTTIINYEEKKGTKLLNMINETSKELENQTQSRKAVIDKIKQRLELSEMPKMPVTDFSASDQDDDN